jgi:hypothetical protein
VGNDSKYVLEKTVSMLGEPLPLPLPLPRVHPIPKYAWRSVSIIVCISWPFVRSSRFIASNLGRRGKSFSSIEAS